MAATFKRLNWEILGISPPTLDHTSNDQHDDQSNDLEEARMSAELWEEPGMPLIHLFRMFLTVFYDSYSEFR